MRNDVVYEELPALGDAWGDFRFERYYTDEGRLLRPALEKLGFTNVQFFMGERDSFGPLSRIVTATDSHGNTRRFVYG